MRCLIVSLFCILSFKSFSFAFFFGNSGCSCSSGCSSSYNACPPPPVCYPTYVECPVAPTYSSYSPPVIQDCCATCSIPCRTKYVKQIFSHKRQKRQIDDNETNENDDEEEINTTDDDDAITLPSELDTTSNDLKCNSERLRNIIITSKGKDITVIKRNIQLIAEKQFHHKYNVICSADGDFSYITNTDEHCQDIINQNTCYVFKQIKRSV